jgi:hypothetical protein
MSKKPMPLIVATAPSPFHFFVGSPHFVSNFLRAAKAGTLGVVLLLAVSVGAGLVGGWQWWTLLILPVAAVGFVYISEDLFESASQRFLNREPLEAVQRARSLGRPE